MSRERESAAPAPMAERAALPHIVLSPDAQHALAEQVRAACAAWFSQAAIVQRHEVEFGLRLARCRTPAEAAGVCGEWLGHRLDSAVAMHHRFLELWMNHATMGSSAMKPAALPRPNGSGGSSP